MAAMIQRVSLERLTIQVKLPRAFALRVWLGTKLIVLAAFVIGCGLEIEQKVEQ